MTVLADKPEETWTPEIVDASTESGRQQLERWRQPSSGAHVVDAIGDQLVELVQIRHPRHKLDPSESASRVESHLAGESLEQFGRWVFYPWRRQVVHLLPPDEFEELRTSRNRYKITPAEQRQLRQARVGVVGLSVGYGIAVTMAMEGVGGAFRLADFDRISLSNTNRVACGVTALGINKAVLAARQIYEIDPYLRVEVFDRGIDDSTLSRFFGEEEPLSILVEECDDLYMKIRLRELARARRIPVVMDTNDRGLLDIERFDREPQRDLLHGLVTGVSAQSIRGLTTRQKVPHVFRILGGTAMSERLAASLAEIDESIVSWSQLASGTALGSALVTDSVRRILLDDLSSSGRFYVDLKDLVSDQRAAAPAAAASSPLPVPTKAPIDSTASSRSNKLPSAVARLVELAICAPSGGNQQPWLFRWFAPGVLRLSLDPTRAQGLLDFRRSAGYLSCGAALETIRCCAPALGLTTSVQMFPEGPSSLVVCDIRFGDRLAKVGDNQEQLVRARVTNRRLGARVPLPVQRLSPLVAAAEQCGAELQLIDDPDSLRVLADVLGQVDQVRFFNPALHREMMSELRWTPEETACTRDGIDLQTLELEPVDEAGLRLLSNPRTVDILRQVGGARIKESAQKAVAAASALGLLTVKGTDATAYVVGGAAVQRIWLEATRLELAFQPLSAAPYLFARVERGHGEGLDPDQVLVLSRARSDYNSILYTSPDRAEVLLFRLAVAPLPSVRSLRRSVSSVLSFG